VVTGGAGGDTIHGGLGDDILLAGAGSDQIWGDDGNDKMEGGPGDDVFFFAVVGGGFEADRVKDVSGGGLDRLDFSPLLAGDPASVNLLNGRATHTNRRVDIEDLANFEDATGGAGDDVFYDNRNNNRFIGNGGSDRYVFHRAAGLLSASHIDTVAEQAGEGLHDEISFADLPAGDPLTADVSAEETLLSGTTIAVHATRTLVTAGAGQRAHIEDITGGAGHDQIYGNHADNKLVGNAGDDMIVGNPGADEIHGNAGEDTIEGGTGGDLIFAGSGVDIVYGNAGADEIHAGSENDYVEGNAGDDIVYGDAGDDDLFGDADNDIIYGGSGNDFIFGAAGGDELEGNDGFDTIFGENGDDVIRGGGGQDRLFGQVGADTIEGGPGRDFILGDVGNDTVRGGSGDDFISGGADTGLQLLDVLALALDDSDFGDRLYGGDGHDFVVGGLPVGYAALEGLVGNLFLDLFKEGPNAPRPMIFSPNDSPFDFITFLTIGSFAFLRVVGG
jgi:Ca2+-binding RTX toxin-like protein